MTRSPAAPPSPEPVDGARPVPLETVVARRVPRAGAANDGAGASTQDIVDSIIAAIVERRLMPGTKLAEQKIADVFGVSRTIVRQALNQLSRDRLVTLEPARGAFVAEPGVAEAREVFEVRAMLEGGMVRQLCQTISEGQVTVLRLHLRDEREAIARGDVTARTRLLAEFHVLLARLQGNVVLAQMLVDLLNRSSLISLMYQSLQSAEHSHSEHVRIVDALELRDADQAAQLMEHHLGNVERNLRLDPRASDLAAVLRPNEPATRR